ncbi:MAG: ABC transporter permease [Bdellovibrionales bacterium]|nr:ABC transporter permease [Bdellovibrionales bacterium]
MREHFQELFKYRALVWALVERHLHARYRGSTLGVLWSFLNPLCLMGVYTLVFQYYIRFNEVQNYTIFLFCGLLPWIWVTSSLIEGSISISAGGSLITKSLFPAHLLPAVAVLTGAVHYVLSLPLLFIFMLVAGVHIPATVIFLPMMVFLQLLFLYGVALFLGSVNVHLRDVQHLVGNALTLLFFLCPVLYPRTTVPAQFQFSMYVNPFAAYTTVAQDLLLSGVIPSSRAILSVCFWTWVTLFVGVSAYQRSHESFAEVL